MNPHQLSKGIAFHDLEPVSMVTVVSISVDRSVITFMMTPPNRNIFCVTGPLCGEFTGHRWIPRKKAIAVELWCFLCSAPWRNGWVNNRAAGDLRRHRAHYDVILMLIEIYVTHTSILIDYIVSVLFQYMTTYALHSVIVLQSPATSMLAQQIVQAIITEK